MEYLFTRLPQGWPVGLAFGSDRITDESKFLLPNRVTGLDI